MNGETKRVLVAVKAYPNPSKKYGETVCVAGITHRRSKIAPSMSYMELSNTAVSELGEGPSIAIHGDTLAVGAHNEDSSATGIDGDSANSGADASGAGYA